MCFFSIWLAAVTWLKFCKYGVKHNLIDQFGSPFIYLIRINTENKCVQVQEINPVFFVTFMNAILVWFLIENYSTSKT